jgi:hypothetical protein
MDRKTAREILLAERWAALEDVTPYGGEGAEYRADVARALGRALQDLQSDTVTTVYLHTIRARIEAFDRSCEYSQSTDTAEVWDLLHEIYKLSGGDLGDLS